MILPNQRSLFDMPDKMAYFNCAYMSPLLCAAVEAGLSGIRRKAQPWKIQPADFFSEVERARSLAATIIGCSSNDVALIPSASYGIATAMNNLPLNPGQEILLLSEQFPSNVYAWKEIAKQGGLTIKTVAHPTDGDWTEAIIQAITSNTALAALPHCHWTDGSLIDLERISSVLRQFSASLVIDATQSLGVMPLNIDRVKPDFLVAACYKWLLGPYSSGILYVSPKNQSGKPIEFGWAVRAGSRDFSNLAEYTEEYEAGARRFDVGERSNFAQLPSLIAGFEQIIKWSIPNIFETIIEKTTIIAERAETLGLGIQQSEHRAGHFLGISLPDSMALDLASKLETHNVFVSIRGASLRVTPHLYNTPEDIDKLFEALEQHS